MNELTKIMEGPVDRLNQALRAGVAFLRGLLTRPRKVASIIPSFSMLRSELGKIARRQQPDLVVELGPGTGGTTEALLAHLSPQAKLLSIEIVPEFVEHLRTIDDPRLIVCEGDATQLESFLETNDLRYPDLIVSGIPFSTMDPEVAGSLMGSIHKLLALGGTFVAYQVRDTVSEYANRFFSAPKVSYIPWNIPPLRVYQWKQQELRETKMVS